MSRRCVLLATLACVVGCVGCGSGGEQGITGAATADACGACHATQRAAWGASRLATSGTSPVFSALAERAGRAWGASAESRCNTCHQPGYGGDHGIGCVACHSAIGNLAARDGLLVVDTTAPVSGPFSNPTPTPAHGSRAYALLESPVLCGTCHEVTGPGIFREPTLDEYDASPAAAAGATCVSCHMPTLEAAPIALGAPLSRPRADHSFVGLDPPWGASPSDSASAAERTRTLLTMALSLSLARSGDGVDVVVVNAAGHAVPTGIAFLRSFWVDVVFTGKDGQEVVAPSVLDLGSQPMRAGRPVPLITDADEVVSHVLAPGATLTVHVEPPAGVELPATAIVATLRAVAVRPDALAALGLEELTGDVPVHTVAVASAP